MSAAGIGVEAMKEVAKAYQARSLQDFQSTLSNYKEELVDDAIVHLHLSRLYDTLLEQNLCRLIEPYSRVEIEYLAKLIKLPTKAVLTKLSQVTFQGRLCIGSYICHPCWRSSIMCNSIAIAALKLLFRIMKVKI